MSHPLSATRPAEILLVEDNENDVFLTRKGFAKAKFMINLNHVQDGEECMEYLRKQGRFANALPPDVILLDLNMPRMDGREVLAAISADKTLQHLPVIILTTSDEENEILKMYQLRCSSYIVKPVSFDRFVQAMQALADYWFTLVVLPQADAPQGEPKSLS
jgi:two-component system, chemotaxis family, response regulator Rcp1